MNETLNEAALSAAAVATGVMIFALPIYCVWKLVASFRRKAIRIAGRVFGFIIVAVAVRNRVSRGLYGRRLWRSHAQLARILRHSRVQLDSSVLVVAPLRSPSPSMSKMREGALLDA